MSSISTFDHNEKICRVLKKLGFEGGNKITDTLQGSIWRAAYSDGFTNSKTNAKTKPKKSSKTAVIKITNKSLHKHSTAVINGVTYKVDENIIKEQAVLKYISEQKDFPTSITKFHKFVMSNSDYFLIMEDGGISLFDFVKNAHDLIRCGQIEISHWRDIVKIILQQMVECLEFIHKYNVCHNDISLENFLINDLDIEVTNNIQNNKKKVKIRFITDNLQIKLCDFGLARIFSNAECKSDKHCGKKQYKSPECINKRNEFSAKKNDIWCFGICIFMATVGHPPWQVASESDEIFGYFMNGYMTQVLNSWNILHYFDEELLFLFDAVFKYENDRINLDKIKQYIYGTNV